MKKALLLGCGISLLSLSFYVFGFNSEIKSENFKGPTLCKRLPAPCPDGSTGFHCVWTSTNPAAPDCSVSRGNCDPTVICK